MTKHPLTKYRETNRLTLNELADRLGVKAAAVSRWENGHRMPRREQMVRIVEETGGTITPNDFLPSSASRMEEST